MTQQEILTLAKAGFTAQQIAALSVVNATPQANASAPVAASAVQPQTVPTQTDPMTQLNQQIAQLTGMVQASNIAGAQQPQPETVDDILAQIINPKDIGGGDKK